MEGKEVPQRVERFEIEAYKKPGDLKELRKTHMPFTGAPYKHPYDPKKVVLVPDPYGSLPFYYEFRSRDISFAEELPSIVNLRWRDGQDGPPLGQEDEPRTPLFALCRGRGGPGEGDIPQIAWESVRYRCFGAVALPKKKESPFRRLLQGPFGP